jgi:hypothetical protein
MDVKLLFVSVNSVPCYLEIDVLSQRSEILVEYFLPSRWHMGVENVEGLAKQLVTGNGKEAGRWHLDFIILRLWLGDRALRLRMAMSNPVKSILAVLFK